MKNDDLKTYVGRRVLVTGHTGFKGGWLCEWLLALGAEVHGLALPPGEPSLFAALDLERRMKHRITDIRDEGALRVALNEIQPEFIFHLAAQSLVRASYREPLATFATNTQGTANLLEAVRAWNLPCSIVVITTDKCYANDGRPHRFREDDPLGGHDPYSASKAGAELVVAAYRDSFFRDEDSRVALASARAGNVIGGGDWAEDRLVPDCMRALSREIQSRCAIRISHGLGSMCWNRSAAIFGSARCWRPREGIRRRGRTTRRLLISARHTTPIGGVRDLVEEILRGWPGTWEQITLQKHLPEAPLLALDIQKAKDILGWQPCWNFAETVASTVEWYREYYRKPEPARPGSMIEFTRRQIEEYGG